MFVPGKTPAIYIRVSTDKQDEGASLETQEEACRRKLAQLGHDPDEAVVYREVHTGVELYERPELTRLRDAIKRQGVSILVCYSLDRLARNMKHAGVVFVEADFNGVDIQFVEGEFDSTPEGGLLRSVQAYAGEIEYARIVDRAKRGHKGRVDQGKPTVGIKPPYGLRWANEDKTRLEEDPMTGPVLRRIFRDIAAGSSGRSVAMRLTQEGIPSPTGLATWLPQTISRLVRNDIYWTGGRDCFAYKTERQHIPGIGRKSKTTLRPKEETVRIENIAPVLVSPTVARAVHDNLANGRQSSTRRLRDPEKYTLRGIARCGYCGCALGVQHSRDGYPYYYCSQRLRYGCPYFGITTAKLETAAWEKVRQIIHDPAWVRRQLEQQGTEDPTAEELDRVNSLLAKAQKDQQQLVKRLALVDDDTAELVAKDLAKYAARIRELDEERHLLLAKRARWQATQTDLANLEAWCATVAARLEEMDFYQRRDVLIALGVQVRVWSTKHEPRIEVLADPGLVEQYGSTR